MSGIGTLSYLWADAHAGAATCMTVDNPKARRRRIKIAGPSDAAAERLSGLLIFCHYLYVRPTPEHAAQLRAARCAVIRRKPLTLPGGDPGLTEPGSPWPARGRKSA